MTLIITLVLLTLLFAYVVASRNASNLEIEVLILRRRILDMELKSATVDLKAVEEEMDKLEVEDFIADINEEYRKANGERQ